MTMANSSDTFFTVLQSGRVLVADGAMGTNLQVEGLPVGAPAEDWVLQRPAKILDLHKAFVDAGSDILLTCSFGGNRLCGGIESDDQSRKVNRIAASLARSVADDAAKKVFVAGSMGPTGKLLEPLGPLKRQDVVDAYAAQATSLSEGGVDLLLLETFYDLDEVTAAIEGVLSASSLPLVCSFSYDRGMRTMMGVTPAQMAEAVGKSGVVAIGANCGSSPEEMEQVIAQLSVLNTGLPIWAKPNAGLPTGSPPRYALQPAAMAEHALRYVGLGARIVGGCCGTTPDHVRAIAEAVHAKPESN
jgi:5-methyltetrahydrofolate--homocysteine methyltransferase